MATITLDKAKQLCTASELRLVEASRRSASVSPSIPRLKAEVQRARKLRDKWRDVHEKQRRAQQTDSRETPGEARSRQKAELFVDVLRRLEEQLKQAEASGTNARSAPAPRPTKKKRAQAHRQDRAQIRKELEMKREKLAGQRPVGATASPKAKATTKTPQPAAVKAKSAESTAQKKPVATKSIAKKSIAKAGIAKQARTKGSPATVNPTLGLQFNATTAAKNDRVKISGLTTRTRGHVSARGKRSQAARDQRN